MWLSLQLKHIITIHQFTYKLYENMVSKLL